MSTSFTTPAAWTACLSAFERELTPQQFATWIRPLAVEPGEGCLKLRAPNRFVLQWVKDRFGSRIAALACEAAGAPLAIEYALSDAPAFASEAETVPSIADAPVPAMATIRIVAPAEVPSFAEPPRVASAPGPRRVEPTSLNGTFTFESFVTGKANQLARAAGLQVAEHPTSYNPLFVYGGVGLGKTHLIQAIGHDILKREPSAKIRYIHAETYVSDVVRAYQHKAFDEFKRYYRSLDLLLIDDIQFFGGKSRTQEEFFYLFNTLIEAHKQVVITCDTYPRKSPGWRSG
jgi:chromosomal replication initiator protein